MTLMATDARLDELLLRWEELAEAGHPPSAQELCQDCPHLAEELQRRIAALQEMDWLADIGSASAAPPPGPALAAGCELVSGYRLLRRLGKGGFGEVWEATGPDGVSVALKLVPRTERAAAVEGRALEVLKELRHPHLLTTLGTWLTEDFLVIAMELAAGTLLDRWQEAKAQGLPGIPREELLATFTQAAEGIDFLHSQGIQHRDIKPQNLLLVGSTLKVADFGLARVLSHSVTGHTGSLTLAYAAPEFFEGHTARSSDQYSLAVAYCQLRSGRRPFEGTLAQVVAGHLHQPPDLSMLPEKERPAVARALDKDPSARWPSCQEFVAALREGSGPVPPPASHRSGRFGKVWPWLIGATLAALAVLVLSPLLKKQPPVPQDRPVLVRTFEKPSSPFNVRSVAAGYVGMPFMRVVAVSNGTGGPALWDVQSGTVLRRFAAEGGPCAALPPFSVTQGLTGHDDGRLILWNLVDGKEVRRFTGHQASVSSVAFSPDGARILSGACDKTLRLWDRHKGEELLCCRGHESIVTSVAFGPRGRLALSGSWDGSVHLWDLATGKQVRQFNGHSSRVTCVAFSSYGLFGLSGSRDCTVRLWDLQQGREVGRFEGHKDQVGAVAFFGQERILSVGGVSICVGDRTARRLLSCATGLPSAAQTLSLFDIKGVDHVLVGTELDGLSLWRLPAVR